MGKKKLHLFNAIPAEFPPTNCLDSQAHPGFVLKGIYLFTAK